MGYRLINFGYIGLAQNFDIELRFVLILPPGPGHWSVKSLRKTQWKITMHFSGCVQGNMNQCKVGNSIVLNTYTSSPVRAAHYSDVTA